MQSAVSRQSISIIMSGNDDLQNYSRFQQVEENYPQESQIFKEAMAGSGVSPLAGDVTLLASLRPQLAETETGASLAATINPVLNKKIGRKRKAFGYDVKVNMVYKFNIEQHKNVCKFLDELDYTEFNVDPNDISESTFRNWKNDPRVLEGVTNKKNGVLVQDKRKKIRRSKGGLLSPTSSAAASRRGRRSQGGSLQQDGAILPLYNTQGL
jgi:hypothetical protein